jgi:hypothetical protein
MRKMLAPNYGQNGIDRGDRHWMVVLTETAHQIPHYLAKFFAAARPRLLVGSGEKVLYFFLRRHGNTITSFLATKA